MKFKRKLKKSLYNFIIRFVIGRIVEKYYRTLFFAKKKKKKKMWRNFFKGDFLNALEFSFKRKKKKALLFILLFLRATIF